MTWLGSAMTWAFTEDLKGMVAATRFELVTRGSMSAKSVY